VFTLWSRLYPKTLSRSAARAACCPLRALRAAAAARAGWAGSAAAAAAGEVGEGLSYSQYFALDAGGAAADGEDEEEM
jgi:hypothetical protein